LDDIILKGAGKMNPDTMIFKELESGNKDLEWFSKHYSNLKKKYPKKFVAVKNQSVVLVENKLDILIEKLREKFGDPNEFLIDFLPDERYILVV